MILKSNYSPPSMKIQIDWCQSHHLSLDGISCTAHLNDLNFISIRALTSSGPGVAKIFRTNPSFWYFSMIGMVDVTYVRYLKSIIIGHKLLYLNSYKVHRVNDRF